jgi:hypothetical protein
VPISVTWIDWPPNIDGSGPSADQWRAHWSRCIEEAADADICLFVNMPASKLAARGGRCTGVGAACLCRQFL